MSLAHDVLKVLAGEPPLTFAQIKQALDFAGTAGELRVALEELAGAGKILKGARKDGFTSYSLPKSERTTAVRLAEKPSMPAPSHAQPSDVAGAAAPASRASLPKLAAQVIALLQAMPRPCGVRDLVERSNGTLKPMQITHVLRRLRTQGLVHMTGSRAGARWQVVSTPGPHGTTETACAAAGAVDAEPEPLSSMALDSADPPQAEPASSTTLCSLPARLLARIESIALDIEDVSGEAIDAGLGGGALKALIAAGGAMRRALLPFNLRN